MRKLSKIPFDKSEMEVMYTVPNFRKPENPRIPVFKYPVSPREAVKAAYRREPVWCLYGTETFPFSPKIIPDNVARGFSVEQNPIGQEHFGGPDMFGVEWEYVPMAGGSMVRPGNPLMTDANDWERAIRFPTREEIDGWGWEQSAEENKKFLSNDRANFFWFQNGCWFERLMSFMEVDNACIALIDEDQKDAVKALFKKTTELYCYLVDKCCEAYGDNITGFTVHDDWGTQRAPFFSFETGREMIVPYMKMLTDHIRSKGRLSELHSCGKNEMQVQNFIAGGWDSWCPMPMNDTKMLYEQYGDRLIISVCDDPLDPNASEDEQYARGVKYAEQFCKPGKPSIVSGVYNPDLMTPAFCRGLYETSRKIYSEC